MFKFFRSKTFGAIIAGILVLGMIAGMVIPTLASAAEPIKDNPFEVSSNKAKSVLIEKISDLENDESFQKLNTPLSDEEEEETLKEQSKAFGSDVGQIGSTFFLRRIDKLTDNGADALMRGNKGFFVFIAKLFTKIVNSINTPAFFAAIKDIYSAMTNEMSSIVK